eukprot:g1371.t1
MRPESGRLTTAQRQVNLNGVGLNTTVAVTDRPVTQQGMMGMRTATAGPGRQVQDNTYYLGLLRGKMTEINTEINKLKGEIDQLHKDNSQYAQLERKYEALITEVRGLEGELADFNLAMDKARTSTDPAEIKNYQQMLKDKNERLAQDVDRVFIERQGKEKELAELDGQIQQMHAAAEEKVNALAPEKLQKYRELLVASKQMGQEVAQQQGEIEAMDHRIRTHEAALKDDRYRDEYHLLQKQLRRLQAERETLEVEASASQLDPAAAREKLLAKVKEDNAKIGDLDRRIKAQADENDRLRRTGQDLNHDLQERKGDSSDSQKYEVLFQRDQEMTSFIEKFEETKQADLAEQANVEKMVVALLEHMSKNAEREYSMPDRDTVNDMREDLTFKERQMESSKSTQARLEAELAKRNQELEKINTLDSKINVELTSLNSKMEQMRRDMIDFDNVSGLRDVSDRTTRDLQDHIDDFRRRRDAVKRQVAQLSSKYEQKKAALLDNDTAK